MNEAIRQFYDVPNYTLRMLALTEYEEALERACQRLIRATDKAMKHVEVIKSNAIKSFHDHCEEFTELHYVDCPQDENDPELWEIERYVELEGKKRYNEDINIAAYGDLAYFLVEELRESNELDNELVLTLLGGEEHDAACSGW